MRKLVLSVIFCSLIAFSMNLVFLPKTAHAQSSAEKNWVTFGVLCPTTGPLARYGQYILNTAKLAIEEANTKWNPPEGGLMIGGKRYYLKCEFYDDEGDPSKSVAGFRKLVEMYKVPFVIGPFGTPQVLATMPVSKELKTFLTSYSASDKAHRMGNPYMLATRPPTSYFGGPLAKACFDRGLKKFAVSTDVSDAWNSMGEEFKANMEKLGGKCVGYEVIDTKTVFDFRSIMTKFKSEQPDVIFVVAYSEPSASMVKHAREIGYTGRFVGTNNWNEIAVKMAGIENSVGTLAETMYWDYCAAHPEADKTGAVTYLSNLYKSKYPGVPLHDLTAVTWDAALTFFKAMELASTATDTSAIQKSLDKSVKVLADKLAIPHDGVLPSGMITGVVEFVTEVQADGSFKKVGELTIPTERLK